MLLPIFEITEMSCGIPESMGELGIGLKSGDTIMFTVFDLYIFYSFNLYVCDRSGLKSISESLALLSYFENLFASPLFL